MRVEANVSLRPRGTEPFGTRVEVKNMNSFRAVERAIAYEIERQAGALDAGETLTQETRGWDDDRQATYLMRSKEDSHDYRYFPEPDLPPLRVDAAWLDALRARLPELPAARRARYRRARPLRLRRRGHRRRTGHGGRLRGDPRWPVPTLPAKEVANLVTGDYGRARQGRDEPDARRARRSGERRRDGRPRCAGSSPASCRGRTPRRSSSSISSRGRPVAAIVETRGLRQISDAGALGPIIDAVLAANPAAVADYRAGKPGARLPRRPGHEGDPRPGERGAGPGGPARAPGRARQPGRGLTRGSINLILWVGRRRAAVARLHAGRAGRGRATRTSRRRTPTWPATSRGAAASATTTRARPAPRWPWRSFAARSSSAPRSPSRARGDRPGLRRPLIAVRVGSDVPSAGAGVRPVAPGARWEPGGCRPACPRSPRRLRWELPPHLDGRAAVHDDRRGRPPRRSARPPSSRRPAAATGSGRRSPRPPRRGARTAPRGGRRRRCRTGRSPRPASARVGKAAHAEDLRDVGVDRHAVVAGLRRGSGTPRTRAGPGRPTRRRPRSGAPSAASSADPASSRSATGAAALGQVEQSLAPAG